jgi:3-oxoacyl-[acyl-carrier protein] reductase
MGSPALVETHELEEDYWDNVIDTNLKGALFCARYALGAMRTQGAGVILNVSSLTALMPTARALSYTVSKSALLALTRQLALEDVEQGIRCNAIVLGHVPTGMSGTVQDEMARVMRGPDFVRTQSRGMGNTAMSAAEVASLIVLLCSDEFRLVTGAAIPVDRALSTGLMASTLRYLHSAELIASP